MGKPQKGRVANLTRTLQRVTTSLNEFFTLLNSPAPASSQKVDWSEVKKTADLVSKHSTTIGLLWTQPTPNLDDAAAAMKTFADTLQALILLCQGSTVNAGPTLTLTIRNAVKGALTAGLSLLTTAVSFSVKGSLKQEREGALPALVGSVWESCNVIKKTPYTNRAAIGRSLAQVATSVKDVLREIGEMRVGGAKQGDDDGCGCGHAHEQPLRSSASHGHGHTHSHGHAHTHNHGQRHTHSHGHEGHNHSHSHGACSGHYHDHGHGHVHEHGDCGTHDHDDTTCSSSVESLEFNDELSQAEMEVADATKGVVTSLLVFLKELLYVAADPQQGNDEGATLYLENVLRRCKSLGVEVDELGASLYPPQEINQLRDRVGKSEALVEGILEEVKAGKGAVPEGLQVAVEGVNTALVELKQCLGGLS